MQLGGKVGGVQNQFVLKTVCSLSEHTVVFLGRSAVRKVTVFCAIRIFAYILNVSLVFRLARASEQISRVVVGLLSEKSESQFVCACLDVLVETIDIFCFCGNVLEIFFEF